MSEHPLNQTLLVVRTIEEREGYVYVKYPRKACSKNAAWHHLLQKPPNSVGRTRRKQGQDNPWEKCHGFGSWGWSAPVNGAAIARGLVDAMADKLPIA